MIRSLSTAVTGLGSHQQKMDVVGNNIANVNTTAFNASHARFEDLVSQTIEAGTAPMDDRGGINPSQIGLGTRIGATVDDHSQGAIESTGRETDLAIEGQGFFNVHDGQQTFYTRDGSFDRDANGELVNNNGLKLMGWMGDEDEINVTDELEPLHIPIGEEMVARDTRNLGFAGNLNANAVPEDEIWQNVVVDEDDNVLLEARAIDEDLEFNIEHEASPHFNDGVDDGEVNNLWWEGYEEFELTIEIEDNDNVVIDDFDAAADVAEIIDQIESAIADDEDGLGVDEEEITITGSGTEASPFSITIEDHDIDDVSIDDDNADEKAYWVVADGNEVNLKIRDGADLDDIDLSDLNNALEEHGVMLRYDEDGDDNTAEIFDDDDYSYNLELSLPDPGDSTSRTEYRLFDSLGRRYDVEITYTYQGSNRWDYEVSMKNGPDEEDLEIDGGETGTLIFDNRGRLDEDASNTPSLIYNPVDGDADEMEVDMDFSSITQLSEDRADETEVIVRESDGYPTGELVSFDIERTGRIMGAYTNGMQETLGYVAMSSFPNPEGLEKEGGNLYQVTANSGDPRTGFAGQEGRGDMLSASLEMSNADLSEEFTELVTTSRGFQANTRVITTSDEVLTEVINMKR